MRHGGAGLNRRCSQVEENERIDSFQALNKFFQLPGFKRLPHECNGETVTVQGIEIRIAYMRNAAGRLIFFLCPSCGQRVRFLYLPDFLCRKCSRLNYRCQQITRGSFASLASIPEKLDVESPKDSWIDADDYVLPRPRYMHAAKYERYRKRFEKHQGRFVERDKRQLCVILKNTEIGREAIRVFFR